MRAVCSAAALVVAGLLAPIPSAAQSSAPETVLVELAAPGADAGRHVVADHGLGWRGTVGRTSFVEAGRRFGIPLSGTMAHSWVLAFPTELEAFSSYAELFGADSTLLLDTFDALKASPQIGRAEAFRLSMKELIEKGSPAEAHPTIWAPFVVVGEGR